MLQLLGEHLQTLTRQVGHCGHRVVSGAAGVPEFAEVRTCVLEEVLCSPYVSMSSPSWVQPKGL